jgi:preprotein translocase subunit SecG
MFYALILIIHIIVSVVLVVSILLQSSKGGGLAGTFGGSGMTSGVFGGRGAAPFLVKVTAISAVIFGITSFSLSYYTPNSGGKSVLEKSMPKSAPVSSAPAVSKEMPVAPATGTSGQNSQTPAPAGAGK